MRLAIPLVEAFNGAWYPIYMKKGYGEEEFKALHEKLQKLEEFVVANNKSETSPFAMGTENPTQLDFHIYVHVERVNMLKGSVFHDSIWSHVNWSSYPRILKLLQGIRERPEFRNGVIANPKPWHEFMAKVIEKPPGERVQLFLPISNE
jgi:glutathione S-transferase